MEAKLKVLEQTLHGEFRLELAYIGGNSRPSVAFIKNDD